jgi:hypothetical protein
MEQKCIKELDEMRTELFEPDRQDFESVEKQHGRLPDDATNAEARIDSASRNSTRLSASQANKLGRPPG